MARTGANAKLSGANYRRAHPALDLRDGVPSIVE
jgi:hypothetical protein